LEAALKVPAFVDALAAAECPGPVMEKGLPPAAVVAPDLAFIPPLLLLFEYAIPPKFGMIFSLVGYRV
jgi:hypothetical protein